MPRIERHQVEAWVNELGKLEVSIPERPPSFDREAFLTEHPELREHLHQLAELAAGRRRDAEIVIGEIYSHFLTGAPSRRGLIVSLRALASVLEDDDEQAPHRRRSEEEHGHH